jgi:F420H(2)-dependent quinone reductase
MREVLMRGAGRLNVWVYRLSGGRLLGRLPSGAPVCLLTTAGRKSGRRRSVPLLYLRDGNDLVVVASQGGAPQHPGWYFNLQADPKAEVEIGRSRFAVVARPAAEDERAALWPRLVAIYPPYGDYQRRTTRRIPVMRLSPV